MNARGDTDRAIAMATDLATNRFRDDRVYIGTLTDHGSAPYRNDKDNEPSYYVTLKTAAGDKTVWGVDLQRARGSDGIQKGDDLALSRLGARHVTVRVVEKDAAGKPTGKKVEAPAKRNDWEVTRVDKMRNDAKARLEKAAAKANVQPPSVRVFDSKAPKPERHVEAAARDLRQRGPEPQPPR